MTRILLLALAVSCSSLSQKRAPSAESSNVEIPYNEIFDRIGDIRPEYEGIYPLYKKFSPERQAAIEAANKVAFRGDNNLLAIPRIFDKTEYDLVLSQGVKQRGRALQLFVQDIVSQDPKFLKDQVIPKSVWERLVQKYQAAAWFKILKPNQVNFWYGPDVIRDTKGKFRIVEDNLGYVGGFGDLVKAKEALIKNVPEYADIAAESPDPYRFYKNLVDRYKQRNPIPDSKVVLVQYVQNYASDNEPNRFKELLKREGITTVRLNPYKTDDARMASHLSVDETGVYLVTPQGQGKKTLRERVGFIITDMEAMDLDPTHPAFHNKRVLEEARAHLEEDLSPALKDELRALLNPDPDTGFVDVARIENFIRRKSEFLHDLNRRPGVTGVWEAAVKGQVGISSTPIIDDLLGDKEFNIYVDTIVEYYTHAKPILTGLPTRSFRIFNQRGQSQTDVALVNEVFQNIDKFVIKRVDGRAGEAVWVGPKLSPETLPARKAQVLAEPGSFIAQEFTLLSIADGWILDTRVLSEVGGNTPYVSEIPWGRAVSIKGDGKVNLGAAGAEITVFVLPTRRECEVVTRLLLDAR